jgi:outer membrane immunogenic protein
MEASLARKMLVAVSAFVGPLGCSAFAQDAKPPVEARDAGSDNWSGPYVGVIAGGAEGQSSATSIVDCNVYGFLCDPTPHYPQYGALIGATASGSKSQAAFTAGVSAGYNWRLDRFVYGVEADATSLHFDLTDRGSGASLNLGLTNPGPVPVVFTAGAAAEINWLATLRARAGYLVSPDVLVFATGGLALTNLSVSNAYSDNWIYNGGGIGGSRAASNAIGYAFGGGAEWAIAQGWTLKAEYLRVDFGSLTTSGPIYPVQFPADKNPFTSSADLNVNLFRVGLNRRF